MSRLTLRLPESLHQQLSEQANHEGISLNQYIVYALTRQATLTHTVHAVSEENRDQQQAHFTALLEQLGHASFDEVQAILDERDEVDADYGLKPEVVARLQKRLEGVSEV